MAIRQINHTTRRFGLLTRSSRLQMALASSERGVPFSTASSGPKRIVEKLWQEFFADPSQWWDHTSEKQNARHPDFKHKKTQAPLWLDSELNPPWVETELAAMAPGVLQTDLFSWNSRLARYAKVGEYEKAIQLFRQIQLEGMTPDTHTFVPVLNACASLRSLHVGRCIHAQVLQSGCECHVHVGSALVNMYAKCGQIEDAWEVFNRMPTRDVVVWNAMILGLVKSGQGQKALNLFKRMREEGVKPAPVTFVGFLNACAGVAALEEGRRLHQQIIQSGCQSHVHVGTSLIDMYTKCGSIEDACKVFEEMPTRSVVSWNAMILGYVRCGQGQKALNLYQQMQREGVKPAPLTFVGALNACASTMSLEEGRCIHEQIIQEGCENDAFVNNSLVDMYAKCGSIEEAWREFSKISTHDVVAWNAIILGYVKCGQGQLALNLYRKMQLEGVKPDPVTFVGVLNACASIAALEEGRCVHEQIIQRNCPSDVFLGNSLIDMYAKCGSIDEARRVFNRMPERDVISWNSMLGAYALHAHARESLQHFEQMCRDSVRINQVTFLSLLSACSHAGLVDEGLHYFDSMTSVYRMSATVEHYSCMVDLLGRAGRLYEAEDLIKAMSCESNQAVWKSLLAACRVHGNVEMGERGAEQVLKLDPKTAAGYVMLSNIYAAAGIWESHATIQQQRLEMGMKKSTWIEV